MSFISRVRKPVKREGAEQSIRITLISFALSVIATRLYLQFTGFPQIGGGQLHIAHVLWGGLFLFTAAMIPLIFANRSVYSISAAFAGIGVGLFIDEVGKFITSENNYFYPGAAPIIYALFLLVVLLYVTVKRPPSSDARGELYRSLDSFEEILDNDLNKDEYVELVKRLEHIKKDEKNPEYARLADSLLDFLRSKPVLIASNTSFFDRMTERFEQIEGRIVQKKILKTIVILGLGISGAITLGNLLVLLQIAFSHEYFQSFVFQLLSSGVSEGALSFFFARMLLEGLIGMLLLIAVVHLLLGRDRLGIAYGYFGLLFSLTTISLLVFYFDQFQAAIGCILQLLLLLAVIRYRDLYLNPRYRKNK